jgi:hypothetical protein
LTSQIQVIQMKKQIKISGKTVEVTISSAAEKALSNRGALLVAEMELYFSCLIRKQVRFRDEADEQSVSVMDNLSVRFRPVMTESCNVSGDGEAPPLTDFPIARQEPYIPNWLKIDYKNSDWLGEFGY